MAPKASATKLTLSDEGLMALDEYSRHISGLKATILEKRDIEGSGVEFDIYFPSNKRPDNAIYYVFSEQKLKDMFQGIDVTSYDAFELKFTIISVDGNDSPDSGGNLVVGAHINGSYRPEGISLSGSKPRNVISTTRIDTDRIYNAGFTAHMLSSQGWDPNGTTVTLLIEPVLIPVPFSDTRYQRGFVPFASVILTTFFLFKSLYKGELTIFFRGFSTKISRAISRVFIGLAAFVPTSVSRTCSSVAIGPSYFFRLYPAILYKNCKMMIDQW